MKGNKSVHMLIFLALVFVVQLILSNYVPLSSYVCICLLPLMIATLPLSWRPTNVMIVAFALGLLLDILTGSVLGLSSAPAVLTALLRKPMYRLIVTRDRQDKTIIPTIKKIGFSKFFFMLTVAVIIFMIPYITLDCISFRPWTFILIKLAASILSSLAVSLLLSISFLNRD